jgi:hypothetical protein
LQVGKAGKLAETRPHPEKPVRSAPPNDNRPRELMKQFRELLIKLTKDHMETAFALGWLHF